MATTNGTVAELARETMTLRELLEDVEVVEARGDRNVRVRGLSTDSRRVGEGTLFFAVAGASEDGLRYVGDAVRNGAVAVVAEQDVRVPEGVSYVRVSDCRRAKARMAARFFGHPARKLRAVGITGTNGKTTTAWMVRSVAEYEGEKTLLLGTIAYELGSRVVPAPNTTPDPIDLQGWLAEAVDEGASLAVMEVSSHALEQERVLGIDFRAATFTNLTPEHLDYHGTFEEYRDAKARLFAMLDEGATAVLNADDPVSKEYARLTRARVVTYGFKADADVRAQVRRVDIDGMSFLLRTKHGDTQVTSRLVGRYNLQNALAAASTCLAVGYSLEAVRGGFEMLRGVPGRLEPVDQGQDFRVLVDYAHTDDALKNVLENLRPLTRGRVITVFGCGGDRDATKRPRMGRVASDLSDVLILTSDNPRSEDPLEILAQIRKGIPLDRPLQIEPDRRAAIEMAIREARGGDIVLIAGKGHENEQILAGARIPFDDRQVAREILWKL